jgi:enoyl-CoA hydratase/carnithine racemase
VVVVRGEGRSFSAGLDVKQATLSSDNSQTVAPPTPGDDFGPDSFAELVRLRPEECASRIADFQQAFSWLRRPDLISVAAVQGHAIGAGFQLALACDLRVLAHDAQLAMAEVTLGLVPDLGGTKRLVELVGYARALEICVTGRRLDAAEADRLGLATVVVSRADLDGAVADLVAAVLAGPRDAVVEIKALLAGAAGRSYDAQLRAEREAQTRRLRDLAGLGE